MNWYVDVLKKYAVFSGRARRQAYWMFTLFNVIISIVLVIVGRVIGFSALDAIYSLAVLLPSLAVGVRRLGNSHWAMIRDTVSAPPPGANPRIHRNGRVG